MRRKQLCHQSSTGTKERQQTICDHYATHTLDEAQINYAIIEKELLTIVFTFDKFKLYLIGSKVIVYTGHTALKYLLNKKDGNL